MSAYVVRRLLQWLLILLGVSVVTFFLLYVIPADPARQIGGRTATPEMIANIREQLGLDLPFFERYLRYLNALLHGDLGRSYLQKTEVATLIMSRLPATLLLMVGAIFCELAIGLTMGLVAAVWRNRRIDQVADGAVLRRGVGAPVRRRHPPSLRLRREPRLVSDRRLWQLRQSRAAFAHPRHPRRRLVFADDALQHDRRAPPGLSCGRPKPRGSTRGS